MSSAATRLYVIGDIHGRLDLLEQLIELINLDIKSREGEAIIVTLGDYVDRGPNSSGVLDRLANNPFDGQYVALKGNHEALLEAFLDNPAAVGPDWWHLGGLETVKSFGVAVTSKMRRADLKRMAQQLSEAISLKQSEFLKSLKTSFVFGRYFLCHAGVRPGISLDLQNEEDLLWIRDEFLTSKADFGKVVVHGHTPKREPEILANRINIDTAAYTSGRLTCVLLDERGHRFIATGSTPPTAA